MPFAPSQNLDRWGDITVDSYFWFLRTAVDPPTDQGAVEFMDSISDEVTTGGYARVTLTGGARSTVLALTSPTAVGLPWTADRPDFGTLSAGDTIAALGLTKLVTTDADSPVLGIWPVTPFDSGDIDPVAFYMDPRGFMAFAGDVAT